MYRKIVLHLNSMERVRTPMQLFFYFEHNGQLELRILFLMLHISKSVLSQSVKIMAPMALY
jgi:hypothetical protein